MLGLNIFRNDGFGNTQQTKPPCFPKFQKAQQILPVEISPEFQKLCALAFKSNSIKTNLSHYYCLSVCKTSQNFPNRLQEPKILDLGPKLSFFKTLTHLVHTWYLGNLQNFRNILHQILRNICFSLLFPCTISSKKFRLVLSGSFICTVYKIACCIHL